MAPNTSSWFCPPRFPIRIPQTASAADTLVNAAAQGIPCAALRAVASTEDLTANRSVHTACAEYIEGWYNTRRLHSTLGYLSPNQYEMLHHSADAQAA